jgi:hypothetical protein
MKKIPEVAIYLPDYDENETPDRTFFFNVTSFQINYL